MWWNESVRSSTRRQADLKRFQKEGANGPITPWRQVLVHNVTAPNTLKMESEKPWTEIPTSNTCVVREEKTGSVEGGTLSGSRY